VMCVVVTWSVYTRKGGLLHDIERGGPLLPAVQPAE
jgi:MFS transporter, NNP family, nitrate/nitrite transporter